MSDFPNSVIPLQANHAKHPVTPSSEDSALDLALTIARAADERKGSDIRILRVTEVSYLADYFVIITGFSTAQVRAISRNIEDAASDIWQRHPLHIEGQMEGGWVLQDYGEVIAHVFLPDEREFYGLEAFWGHAEEVPFDEVTE